MDKTVKELEQLETDINEAKPNDALYRILVKWVKRELNGVTPKSQLYKVVKKWWLSVLEYELRSMDRNAPLYKLSKRVFMSLGFWRNRPRGNPAKARESMMANRRKRGLG
jgi:hypothetical protein